MGLAMTGNSNRHGKLRDILAQLRDETYEKIAVFRRDQGQEMLSSPGDEMDVARSTADAEAHASLIERSRIGCDLSIKRSRASTTALMALAANAAKTFRWSG